MLRGRELILEQSLVLNEFRSSSVQYHGASGPYWDAAEYGYNERDK